MFSQSLQTTARTTRNGFVDPYAQFQSGAKDECFRAESPELPSYLYSSNGGKANVLSNVGIGKN